LQAAAELNPSSVISHVQAGDALARAGFGAADVGVYYDRALSATTQSTATMVGSATKESDNAGARVPGIPDAYARQYHINTVAEYELALAIRRVTTSAKVSRLNAFVYFACHHRMSCAGCRFVE
jgi:hypothetical protein